MNRVALHALHIWHNWRAAWWFAVEQHAKAMNSYHQHFADGCRHELYPPKPKPMSMQEAIENIRRTKPPEGVER